MKVHFGGTFPKPAVDNVCVCVCVCLSLCGDSIWGQNKVNCSFQGLDLVLSLGLESGPGQGQT